MAEATTESLKADIAAAYDTYMLELNQAGPHWERKPAGSAGGEDAWCARQVAEHLVGAAAFFGSGIANAVGVAGPTPSRVTLADGAAAVAAMPPAHDGLMAVIGQVSDAQLSNEMELGPLGKTTVGGVMGVVAYHLNDQANQLKTLRGG